jgi:hypothetical protein
MSKTGVPPKKDRKRSSAPEFKHKIKNKQQVVPPTNKSCLEKSGVPPKKEQKRSSAPEIEIK